MAVFRLCHFTAIRDILKSRMPDIVILNPEEFKKELLRDVKDWLKRPEV